MKYTNERGETVETGVLYLNGREFKGAVIFINGYNGYTSTKTDGLLCAIINNSTFDLGKPNAVTNNKGEKIISKYNRGIFYDIV